MSKPIYLEHRERLRRRYLENGFHSLQDYEKLELLLTYSISRKDVKPFAKNLLSKFKSLSGVMDSDINEMMNVNGIGENSSILIKLVRDLCTAYLEDKAVGRDVLVSPGIVVNFCRMKIGISRNECFMVIFVNTRNEFLDSRIIAEGTINNVPVFPRKIVELVIERNASGVILVHNHPSGNTEPSVSDKNLTEELKRISESLDIRILDHIIVSKHSHFSFLENGLL